MATHKLDEEAVFNVARRIADHEARAAYLEQICADSPLLYERVRALLDAHERSDFLQAPPAGAVTLDQPIAEGPGTTVGKYKLMEQIGEGGMGVVYVAEQREPVRRKVALKIIKPGMDTKEVIARFEAERQALALMDHPNIARVLDAGSTESGRPYFVMELVRGIPITDYCDQNNLTARERLDLFVSVCQAVQHAHQKGVIHRDVKPTNILVTLHDGKPVPKIIDFGVAKAINQQLTERTIYTRHMQMVGTPLYMSPEQAEMSGLDVDTRTDIYSLGVLLYELLTGVTPFDRERLREAAYDELRRIIREEEPPKPSTKISTMGAAATAVSEHRKTEPKGLQAILRGDLDWIVMKALEKDRTRRYDSASHLAEDVLHYLHDEAIVARPPSALYQLRRFARRNKTLITTAAVVAATLIVATAISASQAIRATRESHRARDAEQAAKDAERATMDSMSNLAGVYVSKRRFADAQKLLSEIVAVRRKVLGVDHLITLEAMCDLAGVLEKQDALEEAVPLLEEALAGQRRSTQADTVKTSKALSDVCARLSWRLDLDPKASPRDATRSLELARRAAELNPGSSDAAWALAWAEYRNGHVPATEAALASAWLFVPSEAGRDSLLLAAAHCRLGNAKLARDYYEVSADGMAKLTCWELMPKWPEWTEDDSKWLSCVGAQVRRAYGEAASALGLPEAWPPGRSDPARLVEAYTRLAEKHPKTVWLYHGRGANYAKLGSWKDAAADYARAANLDPGNLFHWQAWGVVCLHTGDVEGYERVCGSMFERFSNDSDPHMRVDCVLQCCLRPSTSVALAELDRVAESASRQTGEHAFLSLGKGMAAYRAGRFREAATLLPDEGYFRNPAKDAVLALLFRAMAQQRVGQPDQARQLLQKARHEIEKRVPSPNGPELNIQEPPVVWCMVQAVLREAEGLIEPAGQRPDVGGEDVQKEHPEAAPSSAR